METKPANNFTATKALPKRAVAKLCNTNLPQLRDTIKVNEDKLCDGVLSRRQLYPQEINTLLGIYNIVLTTTEAEQKIRQANEILRDAAEIANYSRTKTKQQTINANQ